MFLLSWLPERFEDNLIKKKVLSSGQHFLKLYVYEKTFHRSRASNYGVSSPIWPVIELFRDFMAVIDTCKFDEDPIKMKSLSYGQYFFHYKFIRDIGGHGNRNLDPICAKSLCSLSYGTPEGTFSFLHLSKKN